MKRRLLAAGLAVALDRALGELPNRYHPVAWLGNGIGLLESCLPRGTERDRRRSGVLLASAAIGGAATSGLVAARMVRGNGLLPLLAEAVLLKQSFAIRALFEYAASAESALDSADVEAARDAVGSVVSRSVGALDATALASAAIESLTENTSDSVVAPLFWYAVLGLPGAFAYRAANTLDAMVGYYDRGSFGTPSARFDDAANLLPARLTALFFTLASAAPVRTLRGTLRDAGRTPSPNAGWPMASAAHALGVRLEKHGHHVLNAEGRTPLAGDIAAARGLVRRGLRIGAAATLVALAGATIAGTGKGRPR